MTAWIYGGNPRIAAMDTFLWEGAFGAALVKVVTHSGIRTASGSPEDKGFQRNTCGVNI